MKVEEATHCDDTLLTGINSLLPQLSGSAQSLGLDELQAIVESDTTHLLVAQDASQILGTLTLVVFRIPTGVRAWIEDVVVSESSRGKGIGGALVEAAVSLAKEKGAKTIDLTSRPARKAANRLYQTAGFELRETNIYRLVL